MATENTDEDRELRSAKPLMLLAGLASDRYTGVRRGTLSDALADVVRTCETDIRAIIERTKK